MKHINASFQVFGGFLINLNSMTPWLSWLRYFSIFHYTFGGLLVNELADLEFCPTTNRTTPTFNDTRKWYVSEIVRLRPTKNSEMIFL